MVLHNTVDYRHYSVHTGTHDTLERSHSHGRGEREREKEGFELNKQLHTAAVQRAVSHCFLLGMFLFGHGNGSHTATNVVVLIFLGLVVVNRFSMY